MHLCPVLAANISVSFIIPTFTWYSCENSLSLFPGHLETPSLIEDIRTHMQPSTLTTDTHALPTQLQTPSTAYLLPGSEGKSACLALDSGCRVAVCPRPTHSPYNFFKDKYLIIMWTLSHLPTLFCYISAGILQINVKVTKAWCMLLIILGIIFWNHMMKQPCMGQLTQHKYDNEKSLK